MVFPVRGPSVDKRHNHPAPLLTRGVPLVCPYYHMLTLHTDGGMSSISNRGPARAVGRAASRDRDNYRRHSS